MFRRLKNINILQNANSTYASMKEYNQEVFTCNYSKRIFSGVQPTGNLHLGNYFGAIEKWIQLQDNKENVIWSIVDMHSITLSHDSKKLNENIFKMTATLVACGVDPEKSILFQQSAIPMHTQLCWVLSSLTSLARLARLSQFKEKQQTLKVVPVSLYTYPILQTADILLYKATHVPVGRDQLQHIQLAQEIAIKFNKTYGDTFPVPCALINENAGDRIKSLRDPSKKMSKSSQNPRSRLDILDEPDVLIKKIKVAVTDCTSKVTYEPEKRPGVSNLVAIHSLLTGKSINQICSEAEGLDTGEYKLVLADIIVEKLAPIREEYLRLIKEPIYLQKILENGRERAMEIASESWNEIQNKVGFQNNICKNESIKRIHKL